jgi:hypothetical protein
MLVVDDCFFHERVIAVVPKEEERKRRGRR